jgi:hypothetical protein
MNCNNPSAFGVPFMCFEMLLVNLQQDAEFYLMGHLMAVSVAGGW